MILGVDVSRYDENVNWQQLRDGGVEFAIVKVSQGVNWRDPAARTHLLAAARAGLVTGIYHWCDPTQSDAGQLDNLLQAGRDLPWSFVCLDVEQYWANWEDASPVKAIKKTRDVRKAEKRKRASIPPGRISSNAFYLADHLKKHLAAETPVVIYTRVSFIMEYARPMLGWLPRFPVWVAQYPMLRGMGNRQTWGNLLPTLVQSGFHPTLPSGCANWSFWQWSGDRFLLPGASSRLDLNVFNGTREDLHAFVQPQGGDHVYPGQRL